jgi:hypothetical protein
VLQHNLMDDNDDDDDDDDGTGKSMQQNSS